MRLVISRVKLFLQKKLKSIMYLLPSFSIMFLHEQFRLMLVLVGHWAV